jgi:hypothetical protein
MVQVIDLKYTEKTQQIATAVGELLPILGDPKPVSPVHQ